MAPDARACAVVRVSRYWSMSSRTASYLTGKLMLNEMSASTSDRHHPWLRTRGKPGGRLRRGLAPQCQRLRPPR